MGCVSAKHGVEDRRTPGRARKRTGSRGVLSALAVLLLAACAPQQRAHPALWQVRGPNGAQGWLFGTVHVLPAGLDWQTPALDRALDHAGLLVFEIDPRSDPAAARRVFLRLDLEH